MRQNRYEMMPVPAIDTDAVRKEIGRDNAREQRWISLYTQLTGVSESEARACWMFAPEAAPLQKSISLAVLTL